MLNINFKNGPIGGVAYVTWPTFEFWDPLLSLVGMELQTSNFAGGLTLRNTKQKNKNWARKGRGLTHVTYFWIFGPLLSLVGMELQTSNFAGGLRVRDTKQKVLKNWPKGAWPRSRDLLLNFRTPIISGWDEVTNVKFCMLIEGNVY